MPPSSMPPPIRSLTATYNSLAGRITRARYLSNRIRPDRWQQAMDEHDAILAAVVRRDGDTLGPLLAQHSAEQARHHHGRAGQPGVIRAALLWLVLAGVAHAQGTVHLLASAGAGSIDPQINYTGQYWQLFTVVYDGLVAFRRVPGPAGLALVPDLADTVPEPTEDGRLYSFHLRPGVRFSDGTPVRASDAAASFRRIFRITGPTAGSFYGGIEGAADCLPDPAGCKLPGVVADDATGTLTIRLTRRDPDFLLKLALPHASILPASAPGHDAGTEPLTGTGPYRFARYDPATGLRLERNPLFRVWNAWTRNRPVSRTPSSTASAWKMRQR